MEWDERKEMGKRGANGKGWKGMEWERMKHGGAEWNGIKPNAMNINSRSKVIDRERKKRKKVKWVERK